MEYLRACAQRLRDGEDGAVVLEDMRQRYTTVRCLNVKTCLVRKMCAPVDGEAPPANVTRLRLPRTQARECKRLGVQAALARNRKCAQVDGRALLADARASLHEEAPSMARLALALLLCTGRRTCEVMSLTSRFEVADTHAVRFHGLAKQRRAPPPLVVPTLAPAAVVVRAVDRLREKLSDDTVARADVSRKYQSLLGRALHARPLWTDARKVHGLRGVYACMVLKLFEWDDGASDAYVAMRVLGHAGLAESLVYTPYRLGRDFSQEPSLGALPPAPHAVDGLGADAADVAEGAESGCGFTAVAADAPSPAAGIGSMSRRPVSCSASAANTVVLTRPAPCGVMPLPR